MIFEANHRTCKCGLRAAIGREAVRAEQQRDVVVLVSLLHLENHRDLREKRLALVLLEILAGLEHHPVFARLERLFGREQFGDASLLVGGALGQWLPVLADVFSRVTLTPGEGRPFSRLSTCTLSGLPAASARPEKALRPSAAKVMRRVVMVSLLIGNG
jgi:hypothetical protein